jgi:hypothetical protein
VKASVGTPREQRQGTHLEVTKGSYRSSFGMVHEIITREQVQKKKDSAEGWKKQHQNCYARRRQREKQRLRDSRPTLEKVAKIGLSDTNNTQDPENHVLGPRQHEKQRLRGSRLKLGKVCEIQTDIGKSRKNKSQRHQRHPGP